MLPRIVLTLMQLGVGWSLGAQTRALVPLKLGTLDIFILAAIMAILVWLTGHIGALVLKDTPAPSSATLSTVLIGAMALAGLTLIPPVTNALSVLAGSRIPTQAYPLLGAVIGYFVKR